MTPTEPGNAEHPSLPAGSAEHGVESELEVRQLEVGELLGVHHQLALGEPEMLADRCAHRIARARRLLEQLAHEGGKVAA